MGEVTRRGLIGGLAVAGAAGVAGATMAAPKVVQLKDLKKEADVACVYHCDFGDYDRMIQMCNNISNHYSVYGANPFDIQIAVVAHSAGVKYFLDNWQGTPWSKQAFDETAFERARALATNGLRVYLCEITFNRLKIDIAKVRPADFITIVPSGVATVAALQSIGFAYIKVQ